MPMVFTRISFTAADLLPQRNPQARDISKQTRMWWPLLPGWPSPCSQQHPSTNQHHRPWWLCSCVLLHLPKKPARVSKAKESLPGFLHLQGTHTPFSIKQQRQKLKLTQTHATCRKHPPLFCSPPNNHGRNSLSQTQELLYSALMSTDCLIFGLINSELLWYLKGGRKKIELIVTTCT